MVVILVYTVLLACASFTIFSQRARTLSSIVIAGILATFLVALLVANIRVSGGKPEPELIHLLTDLSLRMVGLDPKAIDETDRVIHLHTLLSALVAIITLWFAVIVPGLVIIKLRKDIQDQRIVDEYEVKNVGGDDLETMYKYYRYGDDITVFSGDFDWLAKPSKLRELIMELVQADKIRLISYKSQHKITEAWRQSAAGNGSSATQRARILDQLKPCFRFNDREFKFTLIKYAHNEASFLSLVREAATGRKVNIGVHSDKNSRARAIVNIVRTLCDATCKDLPGWDDAEADQGMEA